MFIYPAQTKREFKSFFINIIIYYIIIIVIESFVM